MNKLTGNITTRILLASTPLFAIVLLIVFKLFQTMVSEGEVLKQEAENYTIKQVTIEAERGNIFSSDGKLLATSMPIYDLHLDPTAADETIFADSISYLCRNLGRVFPERTAGQWEVYLKSKRSAGDRYIRLQKEVTFSELQEIKGFPIFNLGKYRGGLIVERRNFRKMPLEQIAQRTIGYDNRNNQAGLEGAYSSYLNGTNGTQWKQKIANGNLKPIESGYIKEPINGYDLVTTIDTRIQDIAHKELLHTLQRFEADHGCVIVMEVKTGKIRAIANLGLNEQGHYSELRNYAVWETTEPGSTFKLASLMVGLEDGAIDTSDIVDTENGIYTIYGDKVKDSNVGYGKKGGYGKITVAETFRKSSNTGIVKALYPYYKERPDDFIDQLYKMGLNDKLGLEIKGEGTPKIPTPEDRIWSGTTLPWMIFGYGLEFTPLQTLTFYNAVANDGVMVKPIFVSSVKDHGRNIRVNETEILNSAICSKKTLSQLQALLEGVVEKGTAKNIRSDEIRMAGKTGTCQLNYWKGGHDYQASFAGYFPADEPRYSCVVVINKPNHYTGYYGSTVAAPIFKAIAKEIYLMTPVESEMTELQFEKSEDTYIAKAEDALDRNFFPNLRGMDGAEAVQLLENAGYQVNIHGNGKVRRHDPKHGTSTANLYSVNLFLE